MIRIFYYSSLALLLVMFSACSSPKTTDEILEYRIDSVLKLMTLQEKIGQLAQLSSWGSENRPLNEDLSYIEEIKAGRVGSMLNVNGAEMTLKLQKIAVEESRLGIPILFAFDVVHGYKTIFPIPIALASTWDTALVRRASQIAADEATASGQHWTFAPMVDVSRDPRWGRIAESSGEDPFLTSAMSVAQIRGFQGEKLSDLNTMAACAKHFVAYGAAEGGRDYNTCEVSDRTLREIYFPPFKASVNEGVASIMMALNDLNGVPSSASKELKKILRNEWAYESVLISDWNSIGELVSQGKAINAADACLQAFEASIDIDMQGNIYANHLEHLVSSGKITENNIDKAVKRVLRLKFNLGLFDSPYQYCNRQRELETLLKPEFIEFSSRVAESAIVLLQNKNQVLPLETRYKNIAVIGPLANDKSNILGSWRALGDSSASVSILEGMRKNFPNSVIAYAPGCDILDSDRSGFDKALQIASKADVIVACLGESSPEINKTLSASDISIPEVQRELLTRLHGTGKPVVLVLINGRPIALERETQIADAIVEAWFPGTSTGNAVARVLKGEVNPSGKLPVSFPYSTGQIPVYYNHKKFGRTPLPNTREQAKYDDGPVDALYPFGYGLSYTTFDFSDLSIAKKELSTADSLHVRVTVANTGERDGTETVQLYIRDLFADVTRPVAELKGFRKVFIQVGRSVEVQFKVAISDLSFYNSRLENVIEPGEYELMVGNSSVSWEKTNFTVVK